jgi:hypothetical protein
MMHNTHYPYESRHSISRSFFFVGVFLFTSAPLNYFVLRNNEYTMILIAYSFFCFLGSGCAHLCCPVEEDQEDQEDQE